MLDIRLRCDCGKIQGVAKDVSSKNGNRVVCYCSSCQAFQKQLGRAHDVLNEHGGTDIFQVAPSQIEITQGQDQIGCLRLTEKGTYRWYATCCNTPIGNTAGPSLPFIGVIHPFMDCDRDRDLGPVRCHCQTHDALDSLPANVKRVGFPVGLTAKLMLRILGWKLRGMGKPSPLFDDQGAPVAQPEVVG